MGARLRLLAFHVCFLALGCHRSGASPDAGGRPDGGAGATTMVGAAGGTIEAAGASLTIPAGALNRDVLVSVFEDALPDAIPAGYAAAGPVVSITPHGQTFFTPVTLRLPYSGADTDLGLIAVTNPANPQWEFIRPSSLSGGIATVETLHFSTWVVVRVTQARTGDTITTNLADGGDVVSDEAPSPMTGYEPRIDVVVEDTRTTVRLESGPYETGRSFEVILPGVGVGTYMVASGQAAVELSDRGVRYHPERGSVVITRSDDRIGGTFSIELCPGGATGCAVTVMFNGSFDAARQTRTGSPNADLTVALDQPTRNADGSFDLHYVVTNTGDSQYTRGERAAFVGLFIDPPAPPIGGGQAPEARGPDLGDLAPGYSVGGTVTVPPGAVNEDTPIHAVVDNDLAVPERNEGNNATPALYLRPYADLTPSITGIAYTNGIVYLTYDITNVGAGHFPPTPVTVTLCPAVTVGCDVTEHRDTITPSLRGGAKYRGVMIVHVGGEVVTGDARISLAGSAIGYPDPNPVNDTSPFVRWDGTFTGYLGPEEGTASAPASLGPIPVDHFGTAHGGGTDYFRVDLEAGTVYAVGLFGMNDPFGIDNFSTGYQVWSDASFSTLVRVCDPMPRDGGTGLAECTFTALATQPYYITVPSILGEPGSPYYLTVRKYAGCNLTVSLTSTSFDSAASTLTVGWAVRNTGIAETGFDGLLSSVHSSIPLELWVQLEEDPALQFTAPAPRFPDRIVQIGDFIPAGEEVTGTEVLPVRGEHAAGVAAAQVNGYLEPPRDLLRGITMDYLATHETSYDDNGVRTRWGSEGNLNELTLWNVTAERQMLGTSSVVAIEYSVETHLGDTALGAPRPTCFTVGVWRDLVSDSQPPDIRTIECVPGDPRDGIRGRLLIPTLGTTSGTASVYVDYLDNIWEAENSDNYVLVDW